jgi:CRP-like cAMP-binding protein
MYIILEGEIEIRSAIAVLDKVGPGGIFGEMALIGDHRRTASAFAATDCRLAAINERRFLFLVQETPFFALHIMRVLAERILRQA